MTGKEYRSVVDWTVKKCSERSDKPIDTVRAVCKNLGAELPEGDVREISEVMKTNDYMGWRSCSINDAKFCAEIGVTAIGIDDDRIVIITDKADKNNPSMLTKNSTDDIIMTVTDETPALAVSNMQFYSYSYGCGGSGSSGGTGGSCPPSGGGIMEEDYILALRNIFGFSSSTADLIRSLYDKVDKKFPSENYLERAWKCARLLGGIVYGNGDGYSGSKDKFKWEDVAGKVFDCSEKEYFTNTLNFTEKEYDQLKEKISDNYKNSHTSDFAHMQISLSARLAYKLGIDGFVSNIYTHDSNEDVSYLAGWLGDATLKPTGTTQIGDDDYCADLDAENIYRYIIEGKKSINALNIYYSELSRNGNRANKFKSYIDYNTVKKKIFWELMDKDYTFLGISLAEQGNPLASNYYFSLINDEQHHWDTISSKYPDTYNFLKSVENGLQHIRNYI